MPEPSNEMNLFELTLTQQFLDDENVLTLKLLQLEPVAYRKIVYATSQGYHQACLLDVHEPYPKHENHLETHLGQVIRHGLQVREMLCLNLLRVTTWQAFCRCGYPNRLWLYLHAVCLLSIDSDCYLRSGM